MAESSAETNAVLDRVANRWTALVVESLATGTHRYSEIRRKLAGISHKMLAQTLRGLERDGIVTRLVYPVVPPKVEYTLTPLGETLVGPLAELCRWAREHRADIEAARARATEACP